MKKLLLTLLCAGAAAGLRAQSKEWLDPEVNAVNRLEMHAAFFAYESTDAARAGDRIASERFLNLNGPWKFCWVRHAEERPTEFYRTDYDEGHWGEIPVPGMWEMHGYGDPLYLNIGYAWSRQAENDPPCVPAEENHVGSYRRTFTLPSSWNGKQVIAHFGSVTSNLALWVNGRYAGYSEDSKLEAEFDITRYLKPGENLLAFQVFRWCDGTYLEDQDFFRLSGVGRDCYLYARDKRHIGDVRLDASLTDGYTRGRLDVTLTLPAAAKGCRAGVLLTDRQGRTIASERAVVKGAVQRFVLDAGQVQPWSAEIPALYDVLVTLETPAGQQIEAIPLHTGFRDVRIENAQLLVNGKPVLIKGANRHEMDPDGGYVVSEERMLEDIRILKENNFNAVRTCHYPDDTRWYDLCDRYGIYLVAEANVESHGMGYDELTLAKNPIYAKAHLERNIRNVKRNINHPSVIVWSLGNEAGDGPNFDACYDWIKRYDPSRPVHYERAVYNNGGRNTDITCPMYWDYDRCEKYLSDNPDKPLIQCEYAHAMGNSLGGFGAYWELIRKYPVYQGGFIWDFVDQSLRKRGKGGAMIYGYGGDWNPYDASDQNFCDNGLISPDRVLNPHMHEARYHQQPVWTTATDIRNGKIALFNEYFFRGLDDCYLQWEVLCDGKPVRGGVVAELQAGPQQTAELALPYSEADLPPAGELLLTVRYIRKTEDGLLPAGHTLAVQQLPIRAYVPAEPAVRERFADRYTSCGGIVLRENDRNFVIVESPSVRIDFSRASGLMTRYEVDGVGLLDEGAVLQPNFWRAPTDNDFGAGLQRENRVWADPGLELKALDASLDEGVAVIVANYALARVGGELRMEYRIGNTGEVVIAQSLVAAEGVAAPDLLRFGLRMRLPASFDRIEYYGRGPWENYADRKDGALLGLYRQTVDEQFYPYIRPQETGTKSDVRRWRLCDAAGRGVEITSDRPFSASALRYAQESLDEGLEKRQGHSQEVSPDNGVWLCFDKMQAGLGCVDSWGALPQQAYRIPYKDYRFLCKITPTR